MKVNVQPNKDGYTAQVDGMQSMWADGKTIDEAISNFKKAYSQLCAIQFADGNIEFDFHVKLKG